MKEKITFLGSPQNMLSCWCPYSVFINLGSAGPVFQCSFSFEIFKSTFDPFQIIKYSLLSFIPSLVTDHPKYRVSLHYRLLSGTNLGELDLQAVLHLNNLLYIYAWNSLYSGRLWYHMCSCQQTVK